MRFALKDMAEGFSLQIRLFGDPALRRKAKPVKEITQAHRDLLSQMAQAMYAGQGIGLAAPQVGISQALLVADTGSGLYKLINPRIVKKQGVYVLEEGCLSIPGVYIKIKRAKRIRLEASNEFAQPITIEAEDLLACVLQHEIEHLKGRLIIDYVSFFQKAKINKKLEELQKKAKDEGLPESKAKSKALQL